MCVCVCVRACMCVRMVVCMFCCLDLGFVCIFLGLWCVCMYVYVFDLASSTFREYLLELFKVSQEPSRIV